MGAAARNARPHVVSRWIGLPVPAVGVPSVAEGDAVPRHAAHAGGAGRGRRAPPRPAALPPARRAGRARAPLPRPV